MSSNTSAGRGDGYLTRVDVARGLCLLGIAIKSGLKMVNSCRAAAQGFLMYAGKPIFNLH